MKKTLFLKTALAIALVTPLLALAESALTVGGTGAAAARLDFRVVIPRVLFLAVGSGAAGLAPDSTIDTVIFDYSNNATALGTGVAAGTISGNVVPVRVLGNGGVIALESTNTGVLTNTTSDTIPWSEITVVSSDGTNFASPVPGGAAVNLGISSGTKVTNRTANWTFSYANTAVVPPGIYDTNGRVTYIATMP
jgi:hypothetical protein